MVRSVWAASRCGRRIALTSAGAPGRHTTASWVVERGNAGRITLSLPTCLTARQAKTARHTTDEVQKLCLETRSSCLVQASPVAARPRESLAVDLASDSGPAQHAFEPRASPSIAEESAGGRPQGPVHSETAS